MVKKSSTHYPSPHAGKWIFSHDAKKTSRKSKNNHEKACYQHTDVCSPDGKWEADVVEIVFSLDKDPPPPKLKFQKLTPSQVKARTRVVHGPPTHWAFVGVDYDEGHRNVTVRVKGWTKSQRWEVTLPVLEYQE